MAEQKDNNVIKPVTGIEQNYSPEDYPANYYTYALNALNITEEGHVGLLARENSNKEVLSFQSDILPDNYFCCGKILGNNEEVYYFLVNVDGTNSEIGFTDRNNNYTTLVNLPHFNFNLNNPIQGVFRLRLGCEKTIYWVEKNANNPIRYFNTNRAELFKDNLGNWVKDKFNLFYNYERPSFEELEVIEGGILKSMSINVSIQLVDAEMNGTPWLFTTHPIPIYNHKKGAYHKLMLGSSNIEFDPVGGIPTHTGKSLKVVVDNLDEDFKYYRLAFIENITFDGIPTNVYVSPLIPLSQKEFIYNGGLNGFIKDTTLQDIINKPIPFTSEILEQQDNMLLAARLKGKKYDFCSFQKSASKIATAYVTRDFSNEITDSLGNPLNPDTYWLSMSHQGWEAYAVGIVYVFPDFESPAYHIPGRPLNKYFNFDTATVEDVLPIDEDNIIMDWNDGEVTPFTTYITEAAYNLDKDVERWKIRDTSKDFGSWGYMSYYDTRSFNYPLKEDCNGGDYWGVDFANNLLSNTSIRHHRFPSRTNISQNPSGSSTISDYYKLTFNSSYNGEDSGCDDSDSLWGVGPFTIYITYTKDGTTYTDVSFGPYTEADLDPYLSFLIATGNNATSFDPTLITWYMLDNTGNDVSCLFNEVNFLVHKIQGVFTTNVLRQLGFQFTNIEYPHPDIIGHYFVIAERDDFNRTVLDCGFAFPLRLSSGEAFNYSSFSYFTFNYQNNEDYGENDLKNLCIFTPKYNFRFDSLKADFIRLENLSTYDKSIYSSQEYETRGATWGSGKDTNLISRQLFYSQNTTDVNCGTIYPIIKQKEFNGLEYDDTFDPTKRFYNLSWNNRILVANLIRDFVDPLEDHFVSYIQMGVVRDIHTDLLNIVYYRLHPNLLTVNNLTDKFTHFGGDVFIAEYQINNGGMFHEQGTIWVWVVIIVIIIVAIILAIFSGGASLVYAAIATASLATLSIAIAAMTIALIVAAIMVGLTAAAIKSFKEFLINGELKPALEDAYLDDTRKELENWASDASETYFMEGLHFCFIESEINLSLRQEFLGLNDAQNAARIFKYSGATTIIDEYKLYVRDKFMFYESDDDVEANEKYKWSLRVAPYPEVYHYNKDFSRKNKESQYYPLSLTYLCCSDCLEEFTNRIAYSQQSYQEELIDQYRVFLPNNYRDIPGERGELTNIYSRGNKLFIHCEKALYHLPINYQQQVTPELVTYIGTGDFFAIPPIQVLDSENGVIGSQHRFGTTQSKHGFLFVNELERKIYTLENEAPVPISLKGIKNWSDENIPLFFNLQWFTLFGENYPLNDAPYHYNGIGFISTYDNKNERYLITKKDYYYIGKEPFYIEVVIKDKERYYGVTEEYLKKDTLVYYQGQFYIVTENDGIIVTYSLTSIKNTTYFENRSWTISYSKLNNEWISWHSYLPEMYITGINNFQSLVNNTNAKLYEHNRKYSYGEFYKLSKPFIIEFVFNNPLQNFTWEHLDIHCKGGVYDTSTKEFKENRYAFFDKIIFYNHRQSSGIKNIVIKNTDITSNYLFNQIINVIQEIIISNEEGIWYINDIKDYIKDYTGTLFTKEWADIATEYPIDKVSNEDNIEHDKSWDSIEKIRGKFLKVRLIYDSGKVDTQLITAYTVKHILPSYR